MNRTEAARFLKVTEGTLQRWVRQGLIRSRDRHGHDFDRGELVRWARDRGMSVAPDSRPRSGKKEAALVGVIERGAVTVGVEASSAMDVFEKAGAWALPVVDGKRFAGLLNKSTLFDHYRRELVAQRQSS
jgi:hypothetical protein